MPPSRSSPSSAAKRSAASTPTATNKSGKRARSSAATTPLASEAGTLPAIFSAAKKVAVVPSEEEDKQQAIVAVAAAIAADEAATAADADADADADAADSAADSAAAALVVLTEAESETLRIFDLTQKFGPCLGPSRLQRWRRANKYNLNPPSDVLAILERLDEGHKEHQNLWTQRNAPVM